MLRGNFRELLPKKEHAGMAHTEALCIGNIYFIQIQLKFLLYWLYFLAFLKMYVTFAEIVPT